jgi:hypothetical protein
MGDPAHGQRLLEQAAAEQWKEFSPAQLHDTVAFLISLSDLDEEEAMLRGRALVAALATRHIREQVQNALVHSARAMASRIEELEGFVHDEKGAARARLQYRQAGENG